MPLWLFSSYVCTDLPSRRISTISSFYFLHVNAFIIITLLRLLSDSVWQKQLLVLSSAMCNIIQLQCSFLRNDKASVDD